MNEKICDSCYTPLSDSTPFLWKVIPVARPYILEVHYCDECALNNSQLRYLHYISKTNAEIALITHKLTQ